MSGDQHIDDGRNPERPDVRQVVSTRSAPQPAGPYSQGIIAGQLAVTAGFGPQHPVTGAVAPSIEGQTEQVLSNVEAVLAGAEMGWQHVIKVTTHLQHLHRDLAGFNAAYARVVPAPHPVRTTVGSDLMDILVEIDVLAVRP